MKLGTEHREQVYLLVGLVVAAGYMIYLNVQSGRAEETVPPVTVPAPGHPRMHHSTGQLQLLSPALPEPMAAIRNRQRPDHRRRHDLPTFAGPNGISNPVRKRPAPLAVGAML